MPSETDDEIIERVEKRLIGPEWWVVSASPHSVGDVVCIGEDQRAYRFIDLMETAGLSHIVLETETSVTKSGTRQFVKISSPSLKE